MYIISELGKRVLLFNGLTDFPKSVYWKVDSRYDVLNTLHTAVQESSLNLLFYYWLDWVLNFNQDDRLKKRM